MQKSPLLTRAYLAEGTANTGQSASRVEQVGISRPSAWQAIAGSFALAPPQKASRVRACAPP